VVLLETLRVIASSGLTPKATLEFHFYAGEEGGLFGSADVFAKYKADAKTVLAMVNTDMAGYSPSGKISIWTDEGGVDQALTRYVRTVAEAYTGETTEDTCGSRMCSDHNSATSNGFREFLPEVTTSLGHRRLTLLQPPPMCAMRSGRLRSRCITRMM
jgi:leucyl aminopeptidase